MFERKRLHPLSIFLKVLSLLKDALLPIIVVLFSTMLQGKSGQLIWLIIGIPAVVSLASGWAILSWTRYVYYVEADVLKIERGVLIRKKQYIAQNRIQTIDVTEGLIHRLFGVVKLQVQTAGGQKPEAVLSAMSRTDADELRRQLLERDEAHAAERTEANTDKPRAEAELSDKSDGERKLPQIERQLSGIRLFVMALTSGSIGVMASFLGAAYAQAGNIMGDDNVLTIITDWLSELPIVTIIAGVLLVAWMLAIGGTVLKYYGFTIRRSGEKLHITRGLLERRQVAIPLARIQAIRIVESPLRQPFGLVSIFVESAGYGKGKGESTLLFPLLKKSELADFLSDMIPLYRLDYTLRPLPRRSLRKYLTLHGIIALLPAAPLCFFPPWGFLALLTVPLSAAWGFVKYKEAGWAWNGEQSMLIMRTRFMERTVVFVLKNRIQHFQISQSPFQRRSALSTFGVTVASAGQHGSRFKIRHIGGEDSLFLLNALGYSS